MQQMFLAMRRSLLRFISIVTLLVVMVGCGGGQPERIKPTITQVEPRVSIPTPSVEERALRPLKPLQIDEGGEQAKIALMVPLSGPSGDLGRALADAAELALFDLKKTNIALVPLDTKGTEEGAKEAAREAVKQNVRLVLGPLFSHTASAAHPIVTQFNINMISFSNNKMLTRKGIFLLGFMPEEHIERVVNFAYRQGIRDFSALLADDAFGRVAGQSFINLLDRKRLNVKNIEYYQGLSANLSESIRNVIAAPVGEGPMSMEQEKFEGLLVPDGGRNLVNIAARVFRHGVDSGRFRMLGSGQWDDPSIAGEKKLIGSWFASSPPHLREQFEAHFKDNYGYQPVRIASLAYDGVALAALLSQYRGGGNYSKFAITNRQGFSGINGVFRFRSDGTPERALAVIEITNRGFEVIDPAPTRFGF